MSPEGRRDFALKTSPGALLEKYRRGSKQEVGIEYWGKQIFNAVGSLQYSQAPQAKEHFDSMIQQGKAWLKWRASDPDMRPFVMKFLGEIMEYVKRNLEHPLKKLLPDPTRDGNLNMVQIAERILEGIDDLSSDDFVQLLVANTHVLGTKADNYKLFLDDEKPKIARGLSQLLSEKTFSFGGREMSGFVSNRMRHMNFSLCDEAVLIDEEEIAGAWYNRQQRVALSSERIPWDERRGGLEKTRKTTVHEVIHGLGSRQFQMILRGEEEDLQRADQVSSHQKLVRALIDGKITELDYDLYDNRCGVRQESRQFSWLNEAIVESLAIAYCERFEGPLPEEDRSYYKERALYGWLCQYVDERYFVEAYLDGNNRPGETSNRRWDILSRRIKESFGPGFLQALDAVVNHPELGIDRATEIVIRGGRTKALRHLAYLA